MTDKYILQNGLVILGEQINGVESAAFAVMLPAGVAGLPDGCCGAGGVITDWILRGAGARNSRQLIDALDGIGLHRSSTITAYHTVLAGALESSKLAEAIELYSDIILRPKLDKSQFEFSRQLVLSDLAGLDDDPRQNVMLKLKETFYPDPLGRNPMGIKSELESLTAEKARQIIQDRFDLSHSIISVAGKYDFEKICEQIDRLFGNEPNKADGSKLRLRPPKDKYRHIDHNGAQVHIGLMTETATITSENYYNARVATAVLSGGMSARLFTEVREKRGLCYAIGASYDSLKEMAGIGCYAGTLPENAQQTADVIIGEFDRLRQAVSDEEIETAKAGLKSAVIMQSESSSARAMAIANDYYMLGKVRTLEQIKESIDKTTAQSVLNFLNENRFTDYTAATIGPKQIEVKK